MSKLNPSGACPDCGGHDTTEVTFEFDDGTQATHVVCEPCYDTHLVAFREHQRQFRFLIDNGVSRKRANEIMIARIDRGS